MKKICFAALAACFMATGCHHFAPTETVNAETKLVDTTAIATFATDAVYAAHPTRALVENIDVTPAAELGRYMVHIEMTGGAEFRNIYDLVVVEDGAGELSVESLEQVQGH